MTTRALVTGAGGFLGGAVARRLLDRGWAVRSLARGSYPRLEAAGVECHRGDLGDADVVDLAVRGCDVVFHVAAKAGAWGPEREYHAANVLGTRHVLDACRRHGVRRLVHTSSPSVVHAGSDIRGGDESMPYAEVYDAPYPRTKATAEREVLAANGADLATVALRPHLIWGPGDTQLVPRIVARARAGRLRLVGDGSNLVDSVYVDNAAEAHLLSADRLSPGAACAGRAYFITNGEPLPVRDLVNGIVTAAGLPAVRRSIPAGVAVAVGAVLEMVHRVVRPEVEPMMTRFLARHLSTDHWFDISAARRDLGYEPTVSLEEGFRRLRAWFESGEVTS